MAAWLEIIKKTPANQKGERRVLMDLRNLERCWIVDSCNDSAENHKLAVALLPKGSNLATEVPFGKRQDLLDFWNGLKIILGDGIGSGVLTKLDVIQIALNREAVQR